MDKDLILTKIESLRKCISRIEHKCPETTELLLSDIDLQDIISVNLERAVQQCVDIASILISETESPPPPTMALTFTTLAESGIIDSRIAERMSKAVGFRNIAVHEYRNIDWKIVYSIITINIDDFRKFTAAVLEYINIQ